MPRFRCIFFLFTLTFSAIIPSAQAEPDLESGDWIDLFNGKNLAGWTAKIRGHELGDNFANTFRVEDGILKVRYDQYERFDNQFGHLFFANAYSHYALHIRYRFIGEQVDDGPKGWAVRNSGVMLHSQDPKTMTLGQEFPNSIEAQFLGGLSDGKPRPTANLCTPGTHVEIEGKLFTPHCTYSSSETLHGDQWVDVTIIVLGSGTVRHLVNGAEVLTYARPQLDESTAQSESTVYLSSGYLALQSESHPIDFEIVRILPLEGCTNPNATNYKPYAVKEGACLFE
ncbi:MAG: DUF1080 domain-containing protein [Pseudomonadales bacterium]|nr:DUF1080 domain-containing protein [Pseudomonadales bacterium]